LKYDKELINNSLKKLVSYIEVENYSGNDPYDGLKSPIFKLPGLNSNQKIRFYSQQLIKRFPINLRPILRIKKGYNPVTLGLSIDGYLSLSKVDPNNRDNYFQKIDHLVAELLKLKAEGFSGICWGYDFAWEQGDFRISPYKPTGVATGMITNALFRYYKETNSDYIFQICKSSVDFILNDLNRTYDGDTFCFSYSPFDNEIVYNASMISARSLSQIYSVTKDENFKKKADAAVNYILNRQLDNGVWSYSTKRINRIDNYHTGYVLSCLKDYVTYTGNNSIDDKIEKGFNFYKDAFISFDGAPKFYHNKITPIDCTAAAHYIITLVQFGEIEKAYRVAEYVIKKMQDREGYFYFRKFKTYTIKTPFMRWSQAWMFSALSYILKSIS